MSDDSKARTIKVDGETWEVDEAGTLATSPLSEEDSRSAWTVYQVMRREHLARGIKPPPDPLTACVRVAFGTILANYGGLDRGDKPLDS